MVFLYMFQSSANHDFFERLRIYTEKFLSFRRMRKLKEKERAKKGILGWLDAFLWAAGMVLLINQYAFQAYVIPSGSMINTLLIRDRIFVNKIVYGPELLPGFGKLPSPIKPKRNEIIVFENPSYISRGVAFDVTQRIIFMLTLSLVDIDKDEDGQPKAHFLIKRAVGSGGDRIIQDKGNLRLKPAGASSWIDEKEFNASRGFTHNVSRLMKDADYPVLEAAGRAAGYVDLGITIPASLASSVHGVRSIQYPDPEAFNKARLELLRGAHPHERRYAVELAKINQGRYVSEARVLPLGDNRDNSRDGRFFGPVKSSKILGRGSIIYWPGDLKKLGLDAVQRIGIIK